MIILRARLVEKITASLYLFRKIFFRFNQQVTTRSIYSIVALKQILLQTFCELIWDKYNGKLSNRNTILNQIVSREKSKHFYSK